MMRAELKRLHSPDIDDLEAYRPDQPADFGFLLQAMIGPACLEGEESFDMVVCTPEWLKRHHTTEIVSGRHHLIVFEYNFERLAAYIATYIQDCTGETWQEIAQQLSRLGRWEFEDYRE